MAENERTRISGRQTLEFDLLDEETKKKVIKCIQERGRISVVLDERAIVSPGELVAFRQLID